MFVLLALIYRSPLFLWIPLLHRRLGGDRQPRARLDGQRGRRRDRQRPVLVDHVDPRPRRGHRLCAAARRPLPRGAAARPGQARGAGRPRSAPRARRSSPRPSRSSWRSLCLSFAEVNGTAGLGPLGAIGVLTAMVAMLTLLPALLAIFGRRAFWPFVPYGPDGAEAPDATPAPAHVPTAIVGFDARDAAERRRAHRRAGDDRRPRAVDARRGRRVRRDRPAGGGRLVHARASSSTEHRFSDDGARRRRHARPLATVGRLDRPPSAPRLDRTTAASCACWRSAC